jgi:outer membrane protein insertion porin family
MKFNFRNLRTAHSVVAIALNAFIAPTVFAATSSFVIKDIQIDGLKRIEAGSVFAYVPLKRGDVFSDDKASETIRALYATRFFDDVQVETQGAIKFEVQHLPRVRCAHAKKKNVSTASA